MHSSALRFHSCNCSEFCKDELLLNCIGEHLLHKPICPWLNRLEHYTKHIEHMNCTVNVAVRHVWALVWSLETKYLTELEIWCTVLTNPQVKQVTLRHSLPLILSLSLSLSISVLDTELSAFFTWKLGGPSKFLQCWREDIR